MFEVEWEHKDTGQLVRGIIKYDTEFGFWGMTDCRFNGLRSIGYLANQKVTVLGNIYENPELVSDVPMNEKEITERLSKCREMIDAMNRLEKRVPQSRLDAWFQLVKYPLSAMAAMNEKMLGAQLARHRLAKWDKPLEAFNRIVTLTEKYNALKDGKWEGIMSWQPRNLPVFAPVKEEYVDAPLTARTNGKLVF
jgi:hypothetical protein